MTSRNLFQFWKRIGIICLLLNHFFCFAHGGSDPVFIENKGQWDPSIRFIAEIPEGKIVLKDEGISYWLIQPQMPDDTLSAFIYLHSAVSRKYSNLNMQFENASCEVKVTGYNSGKTRYNYYYGNDRSHWVSGCKGYGGVRYQDVYEGVDLLIYATDSGIKYDLMVDQYADASEISFNYSGDLSGLFLEDGCSFVSMRGATLMENRPIAYQTDPLGMQLPVACHYQLDGQSIHFNIEGYNRQFPLVIDPELIFSTFSGSHSDNFGYTACYDDAGNFYSGGIVFGSNFPATTGSYSGGTDMAILKYDSLGTDLLYATFIGGKSGDTPHSLVVNHQNELLIMGSTGSSDYPISKGAYDSTYNGGTKFEIFDDYLEGSDIVVTKLNESGELAASTFMGSSGNDGILSLNAVGYYTNSLICNYGDYQRGDIIVDAADNVFVASSTDSNGFPVASAIQNTYAGGHSDAVVFSLDADLSTLRWSTYLGGTGDDAAYSVKITNDGRVSLGGGTASSDFPTTSGVLYPAYQGQIDGFISILDPEADKIVASSFLGTSAYDQVYFLDIDSSGNLYATGQTRGSYPVSAGVYSNENSKQFIHKLNLELNATVFSTVIGNGSNYPNFSPTAFLASECDNILLSGWGGAVNNYGNASFSSMKNLPVTDDAYSTTTDGSDFYLISLSADASTLLYATYFGSTNNGGDHVDGGTSRFDKRGIVYQSACSCGGSSDNFPTTENAWSSVNYGVNSNGVQRCNNAAFKFDLAYLEASFVSSEEDGSDEGIHLGCSPLTLLFTNTSIGGIEFYWVIDEDTVSTNDASMLYTFEDPGKFTVLLWAVDRNTCIVEDSARMNVFVYEDAVSVSDSVAICAGESTRLIASGGVSYAWSPSEGLSDPTVANPVATPDESTTYDVTIITPNGCYQELEVPVTVIPVVTEKFEVYSTYNCGEDIVYHVQNEMDYTGDWYWLFGDGNSSSEQSPSWTYSEDGTYTVSLTLDEECLDETTVDIVHANVFVPNVFTPNGDDKNEYFEISSPYSMNLEVVDRNGKVVYKKENYQNDWNGGQLKAGVYYYHVIFSDQSTCKGWVQILR